MKPAPRYLSPVGRSLWLLREDAIERGQHEEATVIGWSLMRIGAEMIDAKVRELKAQ